MNAALQNLDFLRQLIEEARREDPVMDMLTLRMLHGTGMGTGQVGEEEA